GRRIEIIREYAFAAAVVWTRRGRRSTVCSVRERMAASHGRRHARTMSPAAVQTSGSAARLAAFLRAPSREPRSLHVHRAREDREAARGLGARGLRSVRAASGRRAAAGTLANADPHGGIRAANPRAAEGGANHRPDRALRRIGNRKGDVARAVHAVSERPGPFVAVNCDALPSALVASEL